MGVIAPYEPKLWLIPPMGSKAAQRMEASNDALSALGAAIIGGCDALLGTFLGDAAPC